MNRTPTKTEKILTLPPPSSAIFEFTSPSQVKFYIPATSTYHQKWHWHLDPAMGCQSISCLQGTILTTYAFNALGSGTTSLGVGVSHPFPPGQRHSWGPSHLEKPSDAIAVLETKDIDLLRNTISAALDAEKVPDLASTPSWLKAVFRLLRHRPRWRRWMVETLLFVQVQTMYEEYGYREEHGRVPFMRMWHATHPFSLEPPPDYVKRLEWDSVGLISFVVQAACQWIGVSLLGMKGKYDEYTLDG